MRKAQKAIITEIIYNIITGLIQSVDYMYFIQELPSGYRPIKCATAQNYGKLDLLKANYLGGSAFNIKLYCNIKFLCSDFKDSHF